MVSLMCWKHNGEKFVVTERTYGRAFDIARDKGAIRAENEHFEIFRWLHGEWVVVGQYSEERIRKVQAARNRAENSQLRFP